MFREMRRAHQAISEADCIRILKDKKLNPAQAAESSDDEFRANIRNLAKQKRS